MRKYQDLIGTLPVIQVEANPDGSEGVPVRVPLSVIVAAGRSIQRLEQCLCKLVPQVAGKEIQIIVSHSYSANPVKALIAKYPGAGFLHSPTDSSLPLLLGIGMAEAQGDIIAITDSTCRVDSNWISAILRAHRESAFPVIGGAVEMGHAETLTDWAAYFCDYGKFMLPLNAGVASEVPGNNVSFKRSALGSLARFAKTGFWKTYWCRSLQEKGFPLLITPEILVCYDKTFRLKTYLVRRFHHGRCFAGMRMQRPSLLLRFVYIFGSLLLPVVFLTRITCAVVPKGRHLRSFLLSYPIVVMAVLAWSLGELCGYLSGKGRSCSMVYVSEDQSENA